MAHTPFGNDQDWDDGEDLELIESEDRLPWLEADDEEEQDEGFATSRLVMLGVLSLALVGALVAGAWFLLGSGGNEPLADGSLIEAPDEPYKTRPDDAGGKTFPGTGDTSYAVGEGQTREGKLADTPPAPPPEEVAGPSLATTLNEGPRAPEPTGVAVQVGAFPTRTDANEAWGRLMRQTEALNGVRNRVVEAQVDIGTVYRLQALPGDRAAAKALCDRLKAEGLACFVK
ncbi:SPOR domain-containing protein [Qipengyuania aquimaris]|uniref:SPOR domain-containing protein n=1 Tax=Qipengyuania aquimaris TaxID=255984 RepID=UPI001FD38A43|nr:SPOR domain-containing protein [Qipengyuania aquimaris]UOR14226.1 SPOR domain-containing protein [Qipengyuania aquimaris]